MAEDKNKLWEERKKGLRESVEIVDTAMRHDKFQTDQKQRIEKALEEATALSINTGNPPPPRIEEEIEGEEKTKEQLIKQFKENIDECLKKIREQKSLFTDLQRGVTVDTAIDNELNDTVRQLETEKKWYVNKKDEIYVESRRSTGNAKVTGLCTKTREELQKSIDRVKKKIKDLLDNIKELIKKEKRMGAKEAVVLTQFMQSRTLMSDSVQKAERVKDALLNLAEGKADSTNIFYEKGQLLTEIIESLMSIVRTMEEENGLVNKFGMTLGERRMIEDKALNQIVLGEQVVENLSITEETEEGSKIVLEIGKVQDIAIRVINDIQQADGLIVQELQILKEEINKNLMPNIIKAEEEVAKIDEAIEKSKEGKGLLKRVFG